MDFDFLDIPIAQLGLTGFHLDRPAGNPYLVGERRDLQRIAAPQHQIRGLPDGNSPMRRAEPKDIGGGRGEPRPPPFPPRPLSHPPRPQARPPPHPPRAPPPTPAPTPPPP